MSEYRWLNHHKSIFLYKWIGYNFINDFENNEYVTLWFYAFSSEDILKFLQMNPDLQPKMYYNFTQYENLTDAIYSNKDELAKGKEEPFVFDLIMSQRYRIISSEII